MSIDTTKYWNPEKLKDVKVFTPETVVKDKSNHIIAWLSTKQKAK